MLVHQISGKGAGIDIIDSYHWPESKSRFVLQPTRGMPVFLTVLNRKVVFSDMRDSAAGNGAAEAGFVGQQIGMAGLIGLEHGFGINLVIAIKLDLLEIVGWQTSKLLHGIHHGVGTVLRQASGPLGQKIFHLVGDFHEPLGIFDPHAARAANRDGLEVLCAHHRTDTRPPSCPMQVVHHRRIAHAPLTRHTDRGDLEHGIMVLFFDPLVGLPDRLAPDLVSARKTDLVSFNKEVHRLL